MNEELFKRASVELAESISSDDDLETFEKKLEAYLEASKSMNIKDVKSNATELLNNAMFTIEVTPAKRTEMNIDKIIALIKTGLVIDKNNYLHGSIVNRIIGIKTNNLSKIINTVRFIFDKFEPNINQLNFNRENALYNYRIFEMPELIELFIEKGINLNNVNINGKTPLMYLISTFFEDSEEDLFTTKNITVFMNILKLYLDNGADVNAIDKEEMSVLFYAIFYTSSIADRVFDLFEKYNVDFNDKSANYAGYSILFYSLIAKMRQSEEEWLNFQRKTTERMINAGMDIQEALVSGDNLFSMLIYSGLSSDAITRMLNYIVDSLSYEITDEDIQIVSSQKGSKWSRILKEMIGLI